MREQCFVWRRAEHEHICWQRARRQPGPPRKQQHPARCQRLQQGRQHALAIKPGHAAKAQVHRRRPGIEEGLQIDRGRPGRIR